MPKTTVQTEKAPAAIGPYAQATKAGGFVFTSGQIALDPATGQMVPGGTEAETRQVLKNLLHVLEASGASAEDVVKTTIFLAELDDFALVNGLYGEVFGKTLPARSTVQAARLPRGARVEIEAIAYVGEKS
ncbi:MAG: RidA family protein [Polyangiaceae bacterium]|nr:RidA family protein [Polyangiaceae bacterium]